MKYTICITRECNLRCTYCYIGKGSGSEMTLATARRAVDFLYEKTPPDDDISVSFFGGEPLMAFPLLKEITGMIKYHAGYSPERVTFSVTTNGVLYNQAAGRFLAENDFRLAISLDGPSYVHDMFRPLNDGSGSSAAVEAAVKAALPDFPALAVNSVYTPATLRSLPAVVDYLYGLGVKRIYLTPDLSSRWTKKELDALPGVYGDIAEKYKKFYRDGYPAFINLVDHKISVILRGGYRPMERCRMGIAEFAVAPSGNLYPCERLVGEDSGEHSIGDVYGGVDPKRMACKINPQGDLNAECTGCGIKDFCTHWCGCSNYFASGYYNRVNAFMCASERASIQTAAAAMKEIEEELGLVFMEHLNGRPHANSILGLGRTEHCD